MRDFTKDYIKDYTKAITHLIEHTDSTLSIKLLLESGADANIAAITAAHFGKLDILQMTFGCGANIQYDDYKIFTIAIFKEHVDIVEYLLTFNININVLGHKIDKCSCLKIFKLLEKNGLNINKRTVRNHIKYNHTEIIKYLIDNSFDISKCINSNVIDPYNFDVNKLLIEHNIDIPITKELLKILIMYDKINILEKIFPKLSDDDIKFILQICIIHNKYKFWKIIVGLGIDPEKYSEIKYLLRSKNLSKSY